MKRDLATSKNKDGAFQAMRVGFQGKALVAAHITDSFGQRSLLRFSDFNTNVALPPERFCFMPPVEADVIEQ